MVEDYGVTVDSVLHQEILDRWKKLNIAPYAGFINPQYIPIFEEHNIVDIDLVYPSDFADQMLYYSQHYSSLI